MRQLLIPVTIAQDVFGAVKVRVYTSRPSFIRALKKREGVNPDGAYIQGMTIYYTETIDQLGKPIMVYICDNEDMTDVVSHEMTHVAFALLRFKKMVVIDDISDEETIASSVGDLVSKFWDWY